MAYSMVASHARGKVPVDKIFGASAAAQEDVKKFGKDIVINATIGAILDDDEVLACLPTVEKVYRSLPTTELIAYAPIAGLPEYLEAMIDMTFADNRPDAFINAIATAGGTGVIHNTIANYSEIGDTILTADWYWGTYNMLAQDALRKLDTYKLFNDEQKFNIQSFTAKVYEILAHQDSLIAVINTPAHNPTGFSLTDNDWDDVLAVAKAVAAKGKKMILLVDVAYIDYAGEKNECRAFMKKFSKLPAEILVIIGASMSKGFTMYGQRTGVMIGVTSDADVSREFDAVNRYTSRATWSNINRPCMRMMAMIHNDPVLTAQADKEREDLYHLIKQRAAIFVDEAQACELKMLPYVAGFFLSIPTSKPDAVCTKLHENHLFAVPLAMGVRVAVCAVPTHKMSGMATQIKRAVDFVEG